MGLTQAKATKYADALQNEIVRFFWDRAIPGCFTAEEITQHKIDHIMSADCWNMLPQWAIGQIEGAWKACMSVLQRRLVWTHVLPTPLFEHRKMAFQMEDAGLRKIIEGRSDFCYVVDLYVRGIVTEVLIPFNAKQRAEDQKRPHIREKFVNVRNGGNDIRVEPKILQHAGTIDQKLVVSHV